MASNPSYNEKTSALEVAITYSSRCAGKTILITGVSPGGIGDGTARAFAHGGASTIIITGRDDTKLSAMNKSLSSAYPSTRFRPLKLDLNTLATVKNSAEELLNDPTIPQIDILVANAGLNSFKNIRTETADGLETHFGVNHIAHFLFVTTLLPKLRAAAKKTAPGETRIIVLTSGGAMASPIRFDDSNYTGKDVPDSQKPNWGPLSMMLQRSEPEAYEYMVAYGQSKTANILFALQLNTLLSGSGIYSFAVHPGFVDSTGAQEAMGEGGITEVMKGFFGFMKSVDQGAATSVVAALDPGLKPEAGVLLADCQVKMEMCPAWAQDQEAAERLWGLSEGIVREKLGV